MVYANNKHFGNGNLRIYENQKFSKRLNELEPCFWTNSLNISDKNIG